METEGKDRSDRIPAGAEGPGAGGPAVRAAAPAVDLVIFSLNGDLYAFDGADVIELLPYGTVTFLSGCPDTVEGIINLRGAIESVLDLHRLLGLPPSAPTRKTRIVMAARDGVRSGIRVDAVVDVVTVAADGIKRPLSTLGPAVREYVLGGETLRDGRYVTLLDTGKILAGIAA